MYICYTYVTHYKLLLCFMPSILGLDHYLCKITNLVGVYIYLILRILSMFVCNSEHSYMRLGASREPHTSYLIYLYHSSYL